MAKSQKKFKIILFTILLVASFLRLWRLTEVPVSLFGDELDVGYHAYSILKTGKDYSGNSWPLHFQSLAEWRTPLYLYSVVPTVAIFGISPLGVRLPAAFFGILGVLGLYYLVKQMTKNEALALVAAAVLALSPWHIQYSRAAFEVTMLITFILFGLYFFFKSLRSGNWLWVSVAFLVFTPWIYSTAKLFTPLLLPILFVIWRKELLQLSKRDLLKAIVAGLVIGLPIAYSTLFGGGSQRFGYVSVLTDPTREAEVGYQREFDARMRGTVTEGLQPGIGDKLLHNKFIFWTDKIVSNYYQALSADFLFIKGDPNPRHSIEGMGQFYKIEFAAFILGSILLFSKYKDRKIKLFIAFWILASIIPAAITRNGGNHATRLILILPPMVFLISYGLVEMHRLLSKFYGYVFVVFYIMLFLLGFIYYQHNYWIHNPWYSERWWHAGYEEAIQSIKDVEINYENVVISMAGEPAWIFFSAWYEYPPAKWHEEFPVGNDVELAGFGKVSHIDKFYFGSPKVEGSFYDWGQVLDDKTLYVASEKEVNVNLIREPERTPEDLVLVKSIAYPSGEPAFYLFSGKK
jgi:hypothetical protein